MVGGHQDARTVLKAHSIKVENCYCASEDKETKTILIGFVKLWSMPSISAPYLFGFTLCRLCKCSQGLGVGGTPCGLYCRVRRCLLKRDFISGGCAHYTATGCLPLSLLPLQGRDTAAQDGANTINGLRQVGRKALHGYVSLP